MSNEWEQLPAPPPPLFAGQKERDFVSGVTLEISERVIGQQVVYYPIDMERSNYHPIYGESLNKTFLPPVQAYVFIEWKDYTVENTGYGIERYSKIDVHFSKRRLTEDKDLYVREGDFLCYGDKYYEIMITREPREMFGQVGHKVEIVAECRQVREGLFNGK